MESVRNVHRHDADTECEEVNFAAALLNPLGGW
jgi:hypothetical protein